MYTFLPLHVWDRELDSRLLLATLEASKGRKVILGMNIIYHSYMGSQVIVNYLEQGNRLTIRLGENGINWFTIDQGM